MLSMPAHSRMNSSKSTMYEIGFLSEDGIDFTEAVVMLLASLGLDGSTREANCSSDKSCQQSPLI